MGLLCVCVVNWKVISQPIELDGQGSKDRGHVIKDNLGCYWLRPLKWQRERKKSGATGS